MTHRLKHHSLASLAVVFSTAFVGCDAVTVGEPIGEGALASEGVGAGGSGAGTSGSGANGSGGAAPMGPPIMTAEQAEAWCENYVFVRYPNADINPAPTPQSENNGVVGNYESLYCYAGPWPELVCLNRPTVEDCVRNILHAPCSATVVALDQCVDGLIGGMLASQDCPLAGTCDAFAQAGCDDIVVSQWQDGEGGAGCGLVVE